MRVLNEEFFSHGSQCPVGAIEKRRVHDRFPLSGVFSEFFDFMPSTAPVGIVGSRPCRHVYSATTEIATFVDLRGKTVVVKHVAPYGFEPESDLTALAAIAQEWLAGGAGRLSPLPASLYREARTVQCA